LLTANDLKGFNENALSKKESPGKKLVSKTSEKDQSETLIPLNTGNLSSKLDVLVPSETTLFMAKDTLVDSRGNEAEANNKPKSRVLLVHKNDPKAGITKSTENLKEGAPSKFRVKIRLNPVAKSGRGRGRGGGLLQQGSRQGIWEW
jgi:hypothetical protein